MLNAINKVIDDKILSRLFVGGFFLVYLVIGVSIYKDYGVSWDEEFSHSMGLVSIKYVLQFISPEYVSKNDLLKNLPELHQRGDKDHGVVFEAPVSALVLLLGLSDSRDIYFFRHLMTFIVCYLGVIAIFSSGRYRFSDWRMGLFGAAIFVFSPRLFAESFYNSKDLLFMGLIAISIITSLRFIFEPKFSTIILHALATAIAIDSRMMGIFVIFISCATLIFKEILNQKSLFNILGPLIIYLVFTVIFVVILWPYLWSDPYTNFIEAFLTMSKYPWNNNVIYLGEYILATHLPWHYTFVWIGVTTPLLYQFLFGIGTVVTLIGIPQLWSKNIESRDKQLQDLFFLGLFFVPILAVIALHSSLYDGWRHLYFVYPAFILISLRGWDFIFRKFLKENILREINAKLIIFATFIWLGLWMIQAHPLQNVYFNALVGKDVRYKFEVDYWGLSSRTALEYLASHDMSDIIHVVGVSGIPLHDGLLLLGSDQRKRFQLVTLDDADYALTNYRWDIPSKLVTNSDFSFLHHIEVDNEPVISIYKKKVVVEKPLSDLSVIKNPGKITGTYFAGQNFEKEVSQVHLTLNEENTFKEIPENLSHDNFSIRWDGFMYFATSGKQILCTVADDGVRLFLNNKKIIDDWSIHPPLRNCRKISVEQGWYPLKLEYFEAGGGETIQLLSGDSENSLTQVLAEHLCCNQTRK